MPQRSRWIVLTAIGALASLPCQASAQQSAASCAEPPDEAGGPSNPHSRHLETNLLPAIVSADTKPFTLKERMRAYNVPGVSVAVIHEGKVAWARGWGIADRQTCRPVTPETSFQAASISKAVTGLLTLRLVEQGKLALDEDVNRYLGGWKLTASPGLAPSTATVRQLLSHTGGTNVHGFPGYPEGAPTPGVAQILAGTPPSRTEAVRIIVKPGAQWQYSGGGYVVLQAALEHATGRAFADLASEEIFRPLGMDRSAFSQPPTAFIRENAATGHVEGKAIPGRWQVYPELAPAGLWTTPADLARLLVDIQLSAAGTAERRLRPAMARQMLTPVAGSWGLGPALYGTGATRRFEHDGVNEGFQATMVAYVERSEGVVVLTNGDQGKRLADEIVRAVANDYGWTELASAPVVEAALSPEALSRLVGLYQGGPLSVFLDLREGHLYAQTGGPSPERLVALSPSRFRTEVSGILIEVEEGSDGAVRGFHILEGAPPLTLMRVEQHASTSDAPLFLRGSMNDWSTSLPMTRQDDGTLATEIALTPGHYQFKIASEDWRSADFGASGTEPVTEGAEDHVLVPHGGNIRLTVDAPGRYRFQLRRGKTDASLSVSKLPTQ